MDIGEIERLIMIFGVAAGLIAFVITKTAEEIADSYIRVRGAFRRCAADPKKSFTAVAGERGAPLNSTETTRLRQDLDRFGYDVVRHMRPNVPGLVEKLTDVYGMKLILSEEASGEHCAYLAEVFERAEQPFRKGVEAVRLFIADERRSTFYRADRNRLYPKHGRVLLCAYGDERESKRVFRNILAAEDKWTDRAIQLSRRA